MTTPESARHDLYNGLVEMLGQQRAGTLMTYLPSVQSSDQLTRSEFKREMLAFRTEIKAEITLLRDEMRARFNDVENRIAVLDDRLSKRIDRVYITLATGLFVVIAAMFGVFAATLA